MLILSHWYFINAQVTECILYAVDSAPQSQDEDTLSEGSSIPPGVGETNGEENGGGKSCFLTILGSKTSLKAVFSMLTCHGQQVYLVTYQSSCHLSTILHVQWTSNSPFHTLQMLNVLQSPRFDQTGNQTLVYWFSGDARTTQPATMY